LQLPIHKAPEIAASAGIFAPVQAAAEREGPLTFWPNLSIWPPATWFSA
jgi:hypothetical protein